MEFPSFLKGKHSVVLGECHERIARFRASGGTDALDSDARLDSSGTDLVVRIAGATRGYVGVAFAPYLLVECLLNESLTEADESAYFAFALGEAWSLLTLFSASANRFFYEGEGRPVVTEERLRQRVRPFLRALLEHWDDLDGLENRCAVGHAMRGFWQLPSSLHFAIANSGVEPAAVTAAIKSGTSASLRKLAQKAVNH